jgi:hypothetical protein
MANAVRDITVLQEARARRRMRVVATRYIVLQVRQAQHPYPQVIIRQGEHRLQEPDNLNVQLEHTVLVECKRTVLQEHTARQQD